MGLGPLAGILANAPAQAIRILRLEAPYVANANYARLRDRRRAYDGLAFAATDFFTRDFGSDAPAISERS